MSRHRYSAGQKAEAWIAVVIMLVGAVVVAAGIVVGSWPLAAAGIAVVVVCVAASVALQRRGASAPVSFSQEFPETTIGPRATADGDSAPPIDTEPTHTATDTS